MLRRDFLRTAGVTGALLAAPRGLQALADPGPGVPDDAPKTGFEENGGAAWTTHAEELAFLQTIAAASKRMRLQRYGTTLEGRPIHLVSLGDPVPLRYNTAGRQPVTLFVCSQHGNEPAGREVGLQLIRDLAYTTDAELLGQLRGQTMLVVPSANPDGREANTRGNAEGTDINRDHLALETPEGQAIARIIKRWSPDLVLDLHEYGPSVPVLYDDDILYLWPRNLNVDPAIHDLSKELAELYIAAGAVAAGYTADEYGLYKAGDTEVTQTAGDEDEGICRNAVGLRHCLGILVESAVTQNPRQSPTEPISQAETNRRRVASQRQVAADTLRFMRARGNAAKDASDSAPIRAARNGNPVYFYGADNDEPAAEEVQDPPPCGYELTRPQAETAGLAYRMSLHGIRTTRRSDGSVFVPMTQHANPVIPLLFDARARRTVVEGKALDSCG